MGVVGGGDQAARRLLERTVVLTSGNDWVTMWDPATGEELMRYTGHVDTIMDSALRYRVHWLSSLGADLLV